MMAEDAVFLLVVLLPLFAARWRVSLLGLALQGVLLFRAAGSAREALLLDGADFLLVRGLLAPGLLYAIQLRGGSPHRNDVIPANLFAWVLVVVLTTAAFRFAAIIGGEAEGRIAVATAALVLGLFVLSTQSSVFSQIVGVLRIDNAVALFEIAFSHEHGDLSAKLAQIAVTTGAVGLMAWYLRALHSHREPT